MDFCPSWFVAQRWNFFRCSSNQWRVEDHFLEFDLVFLCTKIFLRRINAYAGKKALFDEEPEIIYHPSARNPFVTDFPHKKIRSTNSCEYKLLLQKLLFVAVVVEEYRLVWIRCSAVSTNLVTRVVEQQTWQLKGHGSGRAMTISLIMFLNCQLKNTGLADGLEYGIYLCLELRTA